MLRIVCIHGNANYSQSEILRFQFFLVGEHAKNLFPHCMPVKFLGHADLPFFIPAGLTALLTMFDGHSWSGHDVTKIVLFGVVTELYSGKRSWY